MLNFLRKLRRNNMNSGYLKYAIGEIVLVVIGILIALSINNWNEDLKKERKAEETLEILIDEINKNLLEATKNHVMNNITTDSINLYLQGKLVLKTEKEQANFISRALDFQWKRLDYPTLEQELGPNRVMTPKPAIVALLKEMNSAVVAAEIQWNFLIEYFNTQTVSYLIENNAGKSLLNSLYQNDQSQANLAALFGSSGFDNIISIQYLLLKGANQKTEQLIDASEIAIKTLN